MHAPTYMTTPCMTGSGTHACMHASRAGRACWQLRSARGTRLTGSNSVLPQPLTGMHTRLLAQPSPAPHATRPDGSLQCQVSTRPASAFTQAQPSVTCWPCCSPVQPWNQALLLLVLVGGWLLLLPPVVLRVLRPSPAPPASCAWHHPCRTGPCLERPGCPPVPAERFSNRNTFGCRRVQQTDKFQHGTG